VGILKRGGDIAVKAMPDVTSKSLFLNICKTTSLGTTVMTDEYTGYRSLHSLGFDHKTVCHRDGQFVNGDVHTNGIESFWAQLKRSINGTFHHVSSRHLQKYLNEFAYRHNHRYSVQAMFSRLVATVGEKHDLAE
jgi:transposase